VTAATTGVVVAMLAVDIAVFGAPPNVSPPVAPVPLLITEEDEAKGVVLNVAESEAPGRVTSQAAHLPNVSSFLAKHASHFHLPSSYFLNMSPQPAVAALLSSVVLNESPLLAKTPNELLSGFLGISCLFPLLDVDSNLFEGGENTGCGIFMLGGENANCAPTLPLLDPKLSSICPGVTDPTTEVGAENENSECSPEADAKGATTEAGSRAGCGGAPNVIAAAGVARVAGLNEVDAAPNEKPPTPMLADEDNEDEDSAVAPAAAEAPGRTTSQAAHLLNFSSFFAKHASHFHLPSSYFLNISPHPTAVSVAPLSTLIESPLVFDGLLTIFLPLLSLSLPVFTLLDFVTEGIFFADKGNTGCGLFMLGGEKAN
jgi:hypothetical protein